MSRHTKILARSFAGGEMSPEMFSRLDDAKFQAGAETLLNCIPRPTGAVTRRPGTRLIQETRESGAAHLFSFIFSQAQSSVIEAGRATIGGVESGYFRFHTDGGTLLFSMPDRGFKPALVTTDHTFHPRQTVDCSIFDPMTVTLTNHGLQNGDQVWFVSDPRTLPDAGVSNPNRPEYFIPYYVRDKDANSFELSNSATSTHRIAVTEHSGYFPVIFNFNRWRGSRFPQRGLLVSEHRIAHLEPVAFTMFPDSNSPTVTFERVGLGDIYVLRVQGAHLPKKAILNQQVVFSADSFGGELPPSVVEGKIYWVTTWTAAEAGWTISESKNGPALLIGGTSTGTIKMVAAPEAELYGGAADGQSFQLMHRYYAVVYASDPNILNIETSIGNAQADAAGLVFNADAQGRGSLKVHRAHQKGDSVTSYDDAGGIRSFYCERSWWDPESEEDQGIITAEMHAGSGTRNPGSGFRTSAEEAAYWRELPGLTTGASVSFTAEDYGGVQLFPIFTSVSISHGFVTGQAIEIVSGVAPTGFNQVSPSVYYAIVLSATTLQMASTYALAILGTADVDNTSYLNRHGSMRVQAFADFDSAVFPGEVRWPSHGLSNGDTIVFGESNETVTTMHDDLTTGAVYYVREKTDDYFKVSETAAGPLVPLTGSEGGAITATGSSTYEVPHDYSEAELPRIGTTQSGDVMTLASQDHPVLELRRLSSTKWETLEPEFIAAAPVPGQNFEVLVEQGEGQVVTGTDVISGRHRLISANHTFQVGTPVYVDGMPTSGLGSLDEGFYLVGFPSGEPSYEDRIYLQSVESNENVDTGGQTVLPTILDGRVRYSTQGEDRTQRYRVTAIDQNNEESAPNEVIEVSVNLYVSGASATIGWGVSKGAVRYRIYKEISGLFGMIGETDALQFKDDNIGPDLAVSPPILDESLRRTSSVTFDAASDTVAWVAHGLSANTPIVFRTSDVMPGIEEGKTYYVLNPGDDEFEIAVDLESNALDITGTDTGRHTAIAGSFPATATYFEGRRVFGGSRSRPQDIWMTASGTEADLSYSIPTVDTDRIYFRIASREQSAIRHLIPLSQLVMLSESVEYRLTPINDDALTPSSISVRPQSFIGADYPQPSLVNNTVVFSAARGGHIRELGYSRDALGYMSGDLSLRAGHLFDGFTIIDQAYAKAPLPVVWCVSSSGKLLGLTYIPEEGVAAWHQHTSDGGTFESVTVVPEGDVDAVYVIVRRTINGQEKRFVERLADMQSTVVLDDAYHVDCGLTYDSSGTTLTVAGLDHLEGEAVAYLADGLPGTGTVTSGVLTLSVAASTIHVGLPFTTDLKTLPLSMMRVDAFGTGKQKNINRVFVRVFESSAFETGPNDTLLRPSKTIAAGAVEDGKIPVSIDGKWDDDGQILVRQPLPLPLTVSGITLEVASGG